MANGALPTGNPVTAAALPAIDGCHGGNSDIPASGKTFSCNRTANLSGTAEDDDMTRHGSSARFMVLGSNTTVSQRVAGPRQTNQSPRLVTAMISRLVGVSDVRSQSPYQTIGARFAAVSNCVRWF
jgi:hypothetical protein